MPKHGLTKLQQLRQDVQDIVIARLASCVSSYMDRIWDEYRLRIAISEAMLELSRLLQKEIKNV